MRGLTVFAAIAAVVGLLVSAAVAAETMTLDELRREIAKCAATEGELERLQCFDDLAARLGLDGPQAKPAAVQGTGAWNVSVTENPLDDSTTVTLVLVAESGTSSWGEPVALILRCQSNKTELYISWGDYLGNEAKVTSRVGSADAVTQKWNLSTDSQGTFYPGNDIGFVKQLIKAGRLVVQVTPYNESPVTAVFDLTGLPNAIKPLQETCGWQ